MLKRCGFILMLAITISASQEPRSKLNDSQYLREIISSVAEHKQKNSDTSKAAFDPLLQNTQVWIDKHLKHLLKASNITSLPSFEDDLQHLSDLCKELENKEELKKVLDYCHIFLKDAENAVAGKGTEASKRAVLQKAWEHIGQAVYIADHNAHTISSYISLETPLASTQKIQSACVKAVRNFQTRGIEYEKIQQKTNLQDAKLTLIMFEPKVMAGILLTNEGKINLGMIPIIKTVFIPNGNLLEYQIGMARVLSVMNSSWQSILDTILKPTDPTAQDMVRADMNLKSADELTNRHAKMIALSGLLSQLCQGSVGDCFAVSWGIKKHSEYLLQSLQDYSELINKGYLTRNVNGTPDEFYFLANLADEDLQKQIILSPTGAFGSSEIKIWKAPGIIAACRALGFPSSKSNALEAFKPLFKNSIDSIYTTPEQIIVALATWHVGKNPHLDLQEEIRKGKYTFSITQNHLLRAWETALAGMAEAVPNENIRATLLSSVDDVLKNQWAYLKNEQPAELQFLTDRLHSDFIDNLNKQSRFIYNASIPLPTVSSDGSSTSGGFELYKRDQEQPLSMGTRVKTPEEFRSYLIEVIGSSVSNLLNIYTSADETALLNTSASSIVSQMQDDSFLKAVFYAFDDSNKKFPDPVAHFRELAMTPMTSLSGDDPFAVEAIDTGVSFLPDAKTINPHNPYELIKWILDLAAWKEKTEHYLEDTIPEELDPATSPQHAFNIIFEEADIKAFVVSKQTSDHWIQSHIIAPNLHLSSDFIDEATKQSFSKNLMQWLSENVSDFNKITDQFNKSLAVINQKQMSTKDYASSVLSLLTSTFHANASVTKELTVIFDSLFLPSLPASTIQQLEQTALCFANTNWNEGDKDIYFCGYYNPRTSTIGFGTIMEDKTGLSVMNEYEWVDQQQWQVVPVLK